MNELSSLRNASPKSGKSLKTRIALTLLSAVLLASPTAVAAPVFIGGEGAIAFGVGDLGAPINPGAPIYRLNNTNGRFDILTNPGLGLTLNNSIINNTSFTPPNVPMVPGSSIFLTQLGGGNVNGPFGAGSAIITGGGTGTGFSLGLADGGVPGGISASYEILSWRADFIEVGGSPVGTTGAAIAMRGSVPLPQDLLILSMRTELTIDVGGAGVVFDVVEMPGMIIAMENLGVLTPTVIQDNLGGLATPMPFGFAVAANNLNNTFEMLMFTAFPDLGPLGDGLTFGPGDLISAEITVTAIADPAAMIALDLSAADPQLISAAEQMAGVSLPTNLLISTVTLPEPSSCVLAALAIGVSGCWIIRRRRRKGTV